METYPDFSKIGNHKLSAKKGWIRKVCKQGVVGDWNLELCKNNLNGQEGEEVLEVCSGLGFWRCLCETYKIEIM